MCICVVACRSFLLALVRALAFLALLLFLLSLSVLLRAFVLFLLLLAFLRVRFFRSFVRSFAVCFARGVISPLTLAIREVISASSCNLATREMSGG